MAHEVRSQVLSLLEEQERRYRELTEQLSLPDVISNRGEFAKKAREHRELESALENSKNYKHHLRDYQEARQILADGSDEDLRKMAQDLIKELEPLLDQELREIELSLLPKDPNDEKNVILEIRAGVGGDEAGIFVGDLFRMYQRFSESKNFRVELLSLSDASAGGFKEVIALISGEKVYSTLKFESGVHRVQRVPKTEAQGRIHTSTITVAVLPEAEEVDLEIGPSELRIDVFRAGGHGGQSVNTTDSAVRITHLPTGEVVVCQDEKSQLKNKNKAMKVLRTRLLDRMQAEAAAKEAAERRSQVGGGFRNERIRTYNYPQGRVTDHRIGMTTYNLDEVVNGKVQSFIDALHAAHQVALLKGESGLPKKALADEDDA